MAYVEHADWVLIGDMYGRGNEKNGKIYTRVYDCRQNQMLLLDAGGFADADNIKSISYSSGWMYDSKRELVYVFTYRGEAWVLKINPKTVRLLRSREHGWME